MLEDKINNIISPQEEPVISNLIKLSLMKKANLDSDLLVYTEIYKLLGLEKFTELIYLLNGRKLELPTVEDFNETLLTVISFYYKNEGKTWKEIRDELSGIELNTRKTGIKVSQFENFIKKNIDKSGVLSKTL